MKNKRVVFILLAIVGILLIPLLGRWPWTLFDFIVAGAILLGAGLGIELAMRKIANANHRAIIIVVILTVLLLTYIELAVGLVGTPFAGS